MILLYQTRSIRATPMTVTTDSTAGGAMTKIDRKEVMARAWAIFRRTYNFPAIKYLDIGRKCFAWALRRAWVETRQAARLASMSAEVKAERIRALETTIGRAGYIDSGPQWK